MDDWILIYMILNQLKENVVNNQTTRSENTNGFLYMKYAGSLFCTT